MRKSPLISIRINGAYFKATEFKINLGGDPVGIARQRVTPFPEQKTLAVGVGPIAPVVAPNA